MSSKIIVQWLTRSQHNNKAENATTKADKTTAMVGSTSTLMTPLEDSFKKIEKL